MGDISTEIQFSRNVVRMLFSVDRLSSRSNPFAGVCWRGLSSPITFDEIQDSLSANNLLHPDDGDTDDLGRESHISRIAWFVVNGWNDPIELDVGVPFLGCPRHRGGPNTGA